ncbi:hypothetical protein MRX96_011266 [Rhipicephalus microplus]
MTTCQERRRPFLYSRLHRAGPAGCIFISLITAPRLEAAIVRCSSSTECCQEFPAADPDRSGWNPTLQVPDSASVFDLKIPPPDLRPEIRPSRSSSEDIEALNPIVLDTTEPYQTTIMLSHADTRLPRNVSFEKAQIPSYAEATAIENLPRTSPPAVSSQHTMFAHDSSPEATGSTTSGSSAVTVHAFICKHPSAALRTHRKRITDTPQSAKKKTEVGQTTGLAKKPPTRRRAGETRTTFRLRTKNCSPTRRVAKDGQCTKRCKRAIRRSIGSGGGTCVVAPRLRTLGEPGRQARLRRLVPVAAERAPCRQRCQGWSLPARDGIRRVADPPPCAVQRN